MSLESSLRDIGRFFRAIFKRRKRPAPGVYIPPDPPATPDVPPPPAWQPVTSDPLAWRGDFLTFRHEGVIWYLGDNVADDARCASYRAKGYTDILVASNLGPQPGADASFDLFGDPAAYVDRCLGFTRRGIRAIGQIGFEDNWDVWRQYAPDFDRHLVQFAGAADAVVSSWMWGVEIDEGITRGLYTWDDLLHWMEVVATVSSKPQTVHFRQTAWGPEGDTPWRGSTSGRQSAWWREARARLPHLGLGCAFQHRHDRPSDKRPNGGFLSGADDVTDHVGALLEGKRLGDIDVKMISAEYAWNGIENTAFMVTEEEAASRGDLALALGAFGVLNGCTLAPR